MIGFNELKTYPTILCASTSGKTKDDLPIFPWALDNSPKGGEDDSLTTDWLAAFITIMH